MGTGSIPNQYKKNKSWLTREVVITLQDGGRGGGTKGIREVDEKGYYLVYSAITFILQVVI